MINNFKRVKYCLKGSSALYLLISLEFSDAVNQQPHLLMYNHEEVEI